MYIYELRVISGYNFRHTSTCTRYVMLKMFIHLYRNGSNVIQCSNMNILPCAMTPCSRSTCHMETACARDVTGNVVCASIQSTISEPTMQSSNMRRWNLRSRMASGSHAVTHLRSTHPACVIAADGFCKNIFFFREKPQNTFAFAQDSLLRWAKLATNNCCRFPRRATASHLHTHLLLVTSPWWVFRGCPDE